MKKHLLLFLLALFTVAIPGLAETVTFDFPNRNIGNGIDAGTQTEGVINVVFGKGSNAQNAPKYYDTGTSVRLYADNIFTVSSTDGSKITKIEISYGKTKSTISASTGNYTDAAANQTGSWTGSAESIQFTNTGGQTYVQKIVVTYDGEGQGGGEVVDPDPVDPDPTDPDEPAGDVITQTITIAAKGIEHGTAVDGTEFGTAPVSVKFSKSSASTAPTVYGQGAEVRLYAQGTLEINVSNNYLLKGIELTYTNNKNEDALTVSTGNLDGSTWTPNTDTKNVTFTVGGTSGNKAFTAIVVKYVSVGGGEEPELLEYTALNGIGEISFELGNTYELALGASHPAISYSYNPANIISINASGVISATATGNVNVTASWSEDATWKAGSAEFSVNVTGNQGGDEPEGEGWVLVKSLSDLKYGDLVAMTTVSSNTTFALGNASQNNYREKTDATANNGVLTINDNIMQFEVVDSKVNDYPYAFLTTNYKGNAQGYIGNIGGNNYCTVNSTLGNGFAASVTIDDKNEAVIVFNNSSENKYLVYNTSSPRFACYKESTAKGSGYTKVQIYRYVGAQGEVRISDPIISVANNKVSISCTTEDAVIYYTTDGNEPTDKSTKYTEPFAITAKTMVKAIAYVGENHSSVATLEAYFIPEGNSTVAQAIELINDGYEGELTIAGIVTKTTNFNSTYGSITYYISDNGEEENELQVYGGLGLEGKKFSAQSDIEVGASVVVKGNVKLYNGNTPEVDMNSILLEYNGNQGGGDEPVPGPEGTITVAEALAFMEGGFEGDASVKGYISEIQEVSTQYGNATYFIVDNMGDEKSLEIYRGNGLDGKKFESEDEIEVGAWVVVEGKLVNFNGTFEFTTGSKIVEYKAPEKSGEPQEYTALDVLDEQTITLAVGRTYTLPLGNTYPEINFEITDEEAISIVDGVITANKVAEVVVEATWEDSEEWVAGSVMFTVNVTEAPAGNVDVIDNAFTGVSGTNYTDWTGTGVSGAEYAGNSAGGNESVQLRSDKNSAGIVTTVSAGVVTKVSVELNAATLDGRTLDIYGKHEAYTAPSDLYNEETQGTLLGSLKKGETELVIEGEYEFIGLRSKSGAMYLNSIEITWGKGEPATQVAELVYDVEEGDVELGSSVTFTSATEGAKIYAHVEYEDEEMEEIDEELPYTFTFSKLGIVEITAYAYVEDESLEASEEIDLFYNVVEKAPELPMIEGTVTYDFANNNYGEEVQSGNSQTYSEDGTVLSEEPVKLEIVKGTGQGCRFWSTGTAQQFRIMKNSAIRLYIEEGTITEVSFQGGKLQAESASEAAATWTGEAESILFTNTTGSTVSLTGITVKYAVAGVPTPEFTNGNSKDLSTMEITVPEGFDLYYKAEIRTREGFEGDAVMARAPQFARAEEYALADGTPNGFYKGTKEVAEEGKVTHKFDTAEMLATLGQEVIGNNEVLTLSTYAVEPVSGKYSAEGVHGIYSDGTTTGVENVGVDSESNVEYYNMQGVRVDGRALIPGVYITRQGNTTAKVLVK